MNDSPLSTARRSSAWRFSRRELLLVMLTAAAILGWGRAIYQKYVKFSPTPFSGYFVSQLRGDFHAIAIKVGEIQSDSQSESYFGSGNSGKSGIHREVWRDLRLAREREEAFIDALFERTPELVREQGCTVGTGGISRGQDLVNGNEIDIWVLHHQYHRGDTTGVINIWIRRKDEQSVRIWAALDEQKP